MKAMVLAVSSAADPILAAKIEKARRPSTATRVTDVQLRGHCEVCSH
jgi:hypothetical protein